MSKPRICKSCHWLQNRAEPCWSCSRWGKGKTDHYISAEETLGEYLERKEREEMGLVQAKKVIAGFEHCIKEEECSKCPLADVHAKGWGSCSQLAIDTLKSLIEECELLRAAAREAENPSAEILRFDQDDKSFGAKQITLPASSYTSSAPAGHLPLEGKANEGGAEVVATSSTADERDDTVRRCAEYVAEKHLQMDEELPSSTGYYWRNICGINARQEAKGRAKYGQSLEENTTLSTVQRIEHAQEELIDAMKYLEHLKAVATDKLTANDYQRMAMRTAGEYDTDYDQLRNAAYGLNGEAGEVIDLLKKHEFQGHDLSNEKLIDECGDVLWYCALLADALGFSLEQVMNRNIDKLRKRYPDGFDKARSINREGEQ